MLIDVAAAAARRDDDDDLSRCVQLLATAEVGLVDGEAERALLWRLGVLWDHGWQPAEVVHVATRVDARAGRVVAVAVAADTARRDPATLHPRWAAQVQALARADGPGTTGWLTGFAIGEGLDRCAIVRAAVVALGVLGGVGALPSLIPPPGSTASPSGHDADVDDPVLVKVRALLAQAESTTFDAEAATFTAKAHELMARHAIDTAMLWASSERDERPTTIRLAIDDPYADIKALLLHCVATRARCRSVRHVHYGLASVVGFASDLAAASCCSRRCSCSPRWRCRRRVPRARRELEPAVGRSARRSCSRSPSASTSAWRRSTPRSSVASWTRSAATLLPVLAARDDVVDDAVTEMFGELRTDFVRGGSDAVGWASGKLAADLARLNVADLDAAEDHVEAEQPALAFLTA